MNATVVSADYAMTMTTTRVPNAETHIQTDRATCDICSSRPGASRALMARFFAS